MTNDYEKAFLDDGGLRDLLVRGTTPEDWQSFRAFLVSRGYALEFRQDDDLKELPADFSALVTDLDVGRLLQIDIGGPLLNCHFFDSGELELDLDPRAAKSEPAQRLLFEFMIGLGDALQKTVIMTRESRADEPLLRFIPGNDRIECVGTS